MFKCKQTDITQLTTHTDAMNDLVGSFRIGSYPNPSLSDLYSVESISTRKMGSRARLTHVHNFKITPNVDNDIPHDALLTEALQHFLDAFNDTLPTGVRYALAVRHVEFPFNGSNLFVNYRLHTGREGEIIVNVIRTLIQSSKSLAFTDAFDMEMATSELRHGV